MFCVVQKFNVKDLQ